MKFFAYAVFVCYLVALVYPDLERVIYNNEVFSLGGFCALFILAYNKRYLLRALWPLLGFLGYGALLLILSFDNMVDTGIYLFARTLPLWYSVFAFFFAVLCLNAFGTDEIVRLARKLRVLSWCSLFLSGARLSPQVFLAGTTGANAFLFLVFMLLFYVIKPGATTVVGILVAGAFYCWFFFDRVRAFWSTKAAVALSGVILICLYFGEPLLDRFLVEGYGIFGSDNNTTWRLMFWLYLFHERFLESPIFGLAFGTPLFDIRSVPDFVTHDDGTRYSEYTLGTHNSFFYAALRMGAVGFLLLVWSIAKIYAYSFRTLAFVSCPVQQNVLVSFILANLMFLNSALFNVVLESPLYAGNFWFSLGIMYVFSVKCRRGAALAGEK